MKNLNILMGSIIVFLLMSVGMLHAQQTGNIRNPEATSGAVSPQAALPQCHTFSGAPIVSISRDGNITEFRGAAAQTNHMYDEGYALCNTGSNPRYSTTKVGESGFAVSSCNCSGNTCTVTRNTTDGRLRLIQEFTKPANSERSLNIKMTVRNLTGSNVNNVNLRRLAVVDINGAIDEWHHATRDSYSAWGTKADAIPFATRLRHITKTPAAITYEAKTTNFGDNSCNPVDQTFGDPVLGDYGGTVQYNLGTLGPAASKSVTVQYLRD